MIHLHLTADDLSRVRIEPTLGPLAETVFGASLFRRRQRNPLFEGWRRSLPSSAANWTERIDGLVHIGPEPLPAVDVFTVMGPAAATQGAEQLAARRSHLYRELDAADLADARHHRPRSAALAALARSVPGRSRRSA